MGQPLPDIHAPSMAMNNDENGDQLQENTPLMSLIEKKDKLEEELKALGSVLDSHRVTMSTSLTTFDGYPRSDIDVPQIRTTRARIIRLRNDHKALMSRIETGLQDHFARTTGPDEEVEMADADSSAPAVHPEAPAQNPESDADIPFARVNSVVPGSPAEQAGLKAGDSILKFGDVDWQNHEKLNSVARLVSHSEGSPIELLVSREEGNEVHISLTPRSGWGGRGLLGCHLLPL